MFTHLADEGYTLAGFSAPGSSSRELADSERVGTTRAAEGLKDLYSQAKRHLDLPDSTPIVMVGFSRGASAVAFYGRASGAAKVESKAPLQSR